MRESCCPVRTTRSTASTPDSTAWSGGWPGRTCRAHQRRRSHRPRRRARLLPPKHGRSPSNRRRSPSTSPRNSRCPACVGGAVGSHPDRPHRHRPARYSPDVAGDSGRGQAAPALLLDDPARQRADRRARRPGVLTVAFLVRGWRAFTQSGSPDILQLALIEKSGRLAGRDDPRSRPPDRPITRADAGNAIGNPGEQQPPLPSPTRRSASTTNWSPRGSLGAEPRSSACLVPAKIGEFGRVLTDVAGVTCPGERRGGQRSTRLRTPAAAHATRPARRGPPGGHARGGTRRRHPAVERLLTAYSVRTNGYRCRARSSSGAGTARPRAARLSDRPGQAPAPAVP